MFNPKDSHLGSSLQVKEWQEQLLQQLGAETCERLRQRGARKMGQEKRVKMAKEVEGRMGMNMESWLMEYTSVCSFLGVYIYI